MKKRQIAVIGLGRFGMSILRELSGLGHEVLGIDMSMRSVETAAEVATQAVQADATDEANLRELGIGDFDIAVVGIGGDLKSSILTTLALKRFGVKYVVCKAQDERHAEILTKIGADQVVFPERETAARWAHLLISPLPDTDYMSISPTYGIARLTVPDDWGDRKLDEIDLHGRFGVTVLAIRSGEQVIVNPSRFYTLKRGDALVVAGSDNALEELR